MYDTPHSVVIVDDHNLILQGLVSMMEGIMNYQVTATFTLGFELLEFLETNPVDIVLLDISLPDINPNAIILGLSNHTERSVILQLLQNGASGYLLKNINTDELRECLDKAVSKQMVFSGAVQQIIVVHTCWAATVGLSQ